MILGYERETSFPLEDNVIKISLEDCEFGWGYETYTDPYNKLKYAIMLVVELECRKFNTVEEIYGTEGFQLIQQFVPHKIVIIDDTFGNVEYKCKEGHPYTYHRHAGYIDHLSLSGYSCLNSFLKDWEVDINTFLYNSELELIIDNDNN